MSHTVRLHRVRDQRALADEKTCRLNNAAPDMLEVLEKLSSLLVDGEEYVPLELREEMITAVRKARGN